MDYCNNLTVWVLAERDSPLYRQQLGLNGIKSGV